MMTRDLRCKHQHASLLTPSENAEASLALASDRSPISSAAGVWPYAKSLEGE